MLILTIVLSAFLQSKSKRYVTICHQNYKILFSFSFNVEHLANQLMSWDYLSGPKYLPPLACLSTHISFQTAVQNDCSILMG